MQISLAEGWKNLEKAINKEVKPINDIIGETPLDLINAEESSEEIEKLIRKIVERLPHFLVRYY